MNSFDHMRDIERFCYTMNVCSSPIRLVAEFISQQTSRPSPGKFVCNLCRQEFKHSRWLNAHMQSHSNWIKANCKKQPQCHLCFRSFKGPGMLRMHMKTHEVSALSISEPNVLLPVL